MLIEIFSKKEMYPNRGFEIHVSKRNLKLIKNLILKLFFNNLLSEKYEGIKY